MKLILFEFKKIVCSKVFPLFLLITALFITIFFISNVAHQEAIPSKKIEQFSKHASHVLSQFQGDQKILEKGPNPEIEKRIDIAGTLYDQLKGLTQAIEAGKWKKELQLENMVYISAMKFQNVDGSFSMSQEDMKKTMRYNNELLARGLPKEDLDYSIQTSIFMKKIVSFLLTPIPFIILLVLLSIFITKEFEEQNMKLVYSLPISKLKYICVKYVSLLLTGIIWLGVIFILSYTIPSIFGENIGDVFNYPLFANSGDFVSSGEYLMRAIVSSICFMTFVVALLLLVSFSVRNLVITSLVMVFILGGAIIITKNSVENFWNPFVYQNIDQAIIKTVSYYPISLLPLLIIMIFLIFITLILNRKRGI
ncbi:MAG TPA: ABC transporter permease subunit [Rummeliibacillus sp.]|nr:ABC transporter permease subunit [Rummeliibacillus sp.]